MTPTATCCRTLDTDELCDLAGDVGVPAATGMIDRFVDMLDTRLARLREATDPEHLRVAALSLACSAEMLGAARLACRTRHLARVPAADRSSRHHAMSDVDEVARTTATALIRTCRRHAALSGADPTATQ